VTQVEAVSWWTTGGEANGFNAIIDKFNTDNPTIKVSNSAIAGGAGSAAQAALQNRVLNGTPPDTFQVHMGHELLDTYVTPGYMDNIDDLYTANGWTTQFPKGVLDIVSAKDAGGTLHYYSVPLDIHRANVLWYNKTVFTANNLKVPTTWDEFMTVAAALQAKGITPLAIGDNGIWANGMILEDCLLAKLGATGFEGLWTGATDWASADVTAALTTYKQVLTFTNSDHSSLSWDQAADYLIPASAGAQPKAAMTIMGDWADGEFGAKTFTDYSYAAAPGTSGVATKAVTAVSISPFHFGAAAAPCSMLGTMVSVFH
jgi:glucose/mannose transport system substrate-binding protein